MKDKRVAEEVQPIKGFNLVNVGKYAKSMKKTSNGKVGGQEFTVVKDGYTTQRVYQLFQEGKIDMVSISGVHFVKVPQ